MIRTLEYVGLISAGGIGSIGLLAQIPGVKDLDPNAISTWPATALLALITLVCLALVFYMCKQVFQSIKENAEKMGKCADSVNELCAKMNVRPCLMDNKK